jgi:apolipoprotein N-acyltransferase
MGRVHPLLAVLFGAAMSASLAPAEAWWFAPFCQAGLFALLPGAGTGRRFLYGFLFGAGWFGAGLWWIYPGIGLGTQAGAPAAALLGTLLLAYLCLFPACAAAAGGALGEGRARPLRIAVLAATWTLADWLRGHLLAGMPMLPAGLAHTGGPLAGFAPLAGVHGVGLAAALCAAALAECIAVPGRTWRGAGLAGVLALAVPAAGQALRGTAWTVPDGESLAVRLVQTDMRQEDKFDPAAEANVQRAYAVTAAAGMADLTAVPETALAVGWHDMPPAWRRAWTAAAGKGTILVGASFSAPARAGLLGDTSNSMIGIRASAPYRYDKVHLVPLGELLPTWLGWLEGAMAYPIGTLVPGAAGQAPLAVRGVRIGVSLCYENQFEDHLAAQSRAAGVLLVASNLAWARGFASAQHLQASRMRALETGRWLMQVSNADGTALVDPRGAVTTRLPPGRGVLAAGVPAMTGTTPFARHGSVPVLMLCALVAAAALLTRRPEARQARSRHPVDRRTPHERLDVAD